MYKRRYSPDATFEEFSKTCPMPLRQDNVFVRLARQLDVTAMEKLYAERYSSKRGRPALNFRLAFGIMLVSAVFGLSPAEVVARAAKDPHLQFFLGRRRWSENIPFVAASFANWRRRMSPEFLVAINDLLLEELKKARNFRGNLGDFDRGEGDEAREGTMTVRICRQAGNHTLPEEPLVLEKARKDLEEVIDRLYARSGDTLKPRTYRRLADRDFSEIKNDPGLSFARLRAFLRRHLERVRRDIGYVEAYLDRGLALTPGAGRKFEAAREVYRRVLTMYRDHKEHVGRGREVAAGQEELWETTANETGLEVFADAMGFARMRLFSFEPLVRNTRVAGRRLPKVGEESFGKPGAECLPDPFTAVWLRILAGELGGVLEARAGLGERRRRRGTAQAERQYEAYRAHAANPSLALHFCAHQLKLAEEDLARAEAALEADVSVTSEEEKLLALVRRMKAQQDFLLKNRLAPQDGSKHVFFVPPEAKVQGPPSNWEAVRGLSPLLQGNFRPETTLPAALEKYQYMTGHYPRRVVADKLFHTPANLAYCKKQGVLMDVPGRRANCRPSRGQLLQVVLQRPGDIRRGRPPVAGALEGWVGEAALRLFAANLFGLFNKRCFWVLFLDSRQIEKAPSAICFTAD